MPFLTDSQRDQCLIDLENDGFCRLPDLLPGDLHREVAEAIRGLARQHKPDGSGLKMSNCVDVHPAFRQLMMYAPALQLAHDVFGPVFQLNQSNFNFRPYQENAPMDFVANTPWHADGPRPNLFPKVNDAMGLHYLKLGYFLNDLRPGKGGALQVVRGSHKRPEKDNRGAAFDIRDYADDVVSFDVQAGTVVAFHQALWHAAGPNQTPDPRLVCYISYCPCWMRPFDREPQLAETLADCTPEERFLLGVRRDPQAFWLPPAADLQVLARYGRHSPVPV